MKEGWSIQELVKNVNEVIAKLDNWKKHLNSINMETNKDDSLSNDSKFEAYVPQQVIVIDIYGSKLPRLATLKSRLSVALQQTHSKNRTARDLWESLHASPQLNQ